MDGCAQRHLAHGYCNAHYKRWRKTGTPGVAAIGYRPGGCVVVGCSHPAHARGRCSNHYNQWRRMSAPTESLDLCTVQDCGRARYARGYCNTHWFRWREHGDPRAEIPIRGTMPPAYVTVHLWLRAERGPATKYVCRDCPNRADEWAYDHTDPDALLDELARPYSTDAHHYAPLCRSCHRRVDARRVKCRDGKPANRGVVR